MEQTYDQPVAGRILKKNSFCFWSSRPNIFSRSFWTFFWSRETSQGRADYLRNSDYFMAVAVLSAKRSQDPNTQVGACIVNTENKIVGIGHNDMPNSCDGKFPWSRDAENPLENKNMYVCHAELNAIMNKNSADVKGCTIYTTLFPCNECAKLIIQAGIKKVIYKDDIKMIKPKYQASQSMLKEAGIPYEKFEP